MASSRTKWGDKENADLLVLMAEELKPTQAQLVSMALKAQDLGYTYTPKAISQHLQKLRRNNGGPSASQGSATPASTAKKGARTPKTPASSKRKLAMTSELEDDDEEMDTPTKGRKMKTDDDDSDTKPSAKKIKQEKSRHDSDDGLDFA